MIITLVEKTENKKLNNVFIDDKYYFSLRDEDLFKLHIYKGKEIKDEDINYINNHILYTKAKSIALRYISYKMRSTHEVKSKLKENGLNEEIINKTIDFLLEYGYINDEAYTVKYIKDCENLKKWSISKIRYELLKKGISTNTINQLLIENSHNEIEKALFFLKKKKKDSVEREEIIKLKAYLSRKGFNCDIINEAMKKLLKDC